MIDGGFVLAALFGWATFQVPIVVLVRSLFFIVRRRADLRSRLGKVPQGVATGAAFRPLMAAVLLVIGGVLVGVVVAAGPGGYAGPAIASFMAITGMSGALPAVLLVLGHVAILVAVNQSLRTGWTRIITSQRGDPAAVHGQASAGPRTSSQSD